MTSDQINHPSHYGGDVPNNPYETIKVIHAWGLHTSFALGNAVKYISRAGKKLNSSMREDLEKARWYLNWEIDHLEEMQRLSASQVDRPIHHLPDAPRAKV